MLYQVSGVVWLVTAMDDEKYNALPCRKQNSCNSKYYPCDAPLICDEACNQIGCHDETPVYTSNGVHVFTDCLFLKAYQSCLELSHTLQSSLRLLR